MKFSNFKNENLYLHFTFCCALMTEEAYSKPCQTSKIERFVKIVNSFQQLFGRFLKWKIASYVYLVTSHFRIYASCVIQLENQLKHHISGDNNLVSFQSLWMETILKCEKFAILCERLCANLFLLLSSLKTYGTQKIAVFNTTLLQFERLLAPNVYLHLSQNTLELNIRNWVKQYFLWKVIIKYSILGNQLENSFLFQAFQRFSWNQAILTCSNLTIETIEEDVRYLKS